MSHNFVEWITSERPLRIRLKRNNEFLEFSNFVRVNIDHCEFLDSNNCVNHRNGHPEPREEEATRSSHRKWVEISEPANNSILNAMKWSKVNNANVEHADKKAEDGAGARVEIIETKLKTLKLNLRLANKWARARLRIIQSKWSNWIVIFNLCCVQVTFFYSFIAVVSSVLAKRCLTKI